MDAENRQQHRMQLFLRDFHLYGVRCRYLHLYDAVCAAVPRPASPDTYRADADLFSGPGAFGCERPFPLHNF